jgi:tRNA pseudouridine55 synthase
MNGIINILKPPGMTSHQVVAFLRRVIGTRKIGHTGTLDPGAAGVLPLCIGQATRVSEYVLQMDKTYRAELTLGTATDTEDAAGQVIARKTIPPLEVEQVRKVMADFVGARLQIPRCFRLFVSREKSYISGRGAEKLLNVSPARSIFIL